MEDLKKVKNQLQEAKDELKNINNPENQLIFDYVEYSLILINKIINKKAT